MSTRFKILITSGLLPIVFLILSLVKIDNTEFIKWKPVIIPVSLAVLEVMLVAWVVNFQLRGERIFTVLTFPAISVAIFVAFLDVVISTSMSNLNRLTTMFGFALILFLVTYTLTATINILNLSSIKNIPLGQAAKASQYVLTMVFSYFFFALLINLEFNIFIKADVTCCSL